MISIWKSAKTRRQTIRHPICPQDWPSHSWRTVLWSFDRPDRWSKSLRPSRWLILALLSALIHWRLLNVDRQWCGSRRRRKPWLRLDLHFIFGDLLHSCSRLVEPPPAKLTCKGSGGDVGWGSGITAIPPRFIPNLIHNVPVNSFMSICHIDRGTVQSPGIELVPCPSFDPVLLFLCWLNFALTHLCSC